jgi:predicted transcriptional regulator
MEQEYKVLAHLQENKKTIQRKISNGTGLSFGEVNLLLKNMLSKGLSKIKKLNARTMRYILTPKGMQEKSRLAYRYIRQSYRQILKINQALDCLLAASVENQNGKEVKG